MNRCDVIVPIYNALDCVKECVRTLIENTDLKTNGLILIDDCSPDENVRIFLKEVESKYNDKNIQVLYNETNLGFVGTVNKGMNYSQNDVVLLNSDTEVPPRWLENMQSVAYSNDGIATVTPLSNNATLVSVPVGLQANDIPSNMSFNEYAKLVEDNSLKRFPYLPTGHGFCLFIKREVINVVGVFDADTFGKGYGEENDFCYRCLDYGYQHVLADNVIVYHKESQSFTESKKELIEHNLKVLEDRYPGYVNRTNTWLPQFPIKDICENVQYLIQLHKRRNILFVIHDWSNIETNVGGTTQHCLDLINNMREYANFHVIAPEDGKYKVHSYFENEERVNYFNGIYNSTSITTYNKEYGELIGKVIDTFGIDLIHIHHMIGHYFDIVDVAKEKNCKVFITLHDFYSLCPTINMLYMQEKYCLEVDHPNCKECLYSKLGLKNDIVSNWRKQWTSFLNKMDGVITPSKSTKEIIESVLKDVNCTPVEHGVTQTRVLKNTQSHDKFNVAFVGVMAKHKGAEVIQSLIDNTNDTHIQYHVFGSSEYDSLLENKDNYIYHGKYDKQELPKLLNDNCIDVVCNLSIWPETYSYTLTETIASGIPVLSYNYGAVAQRIKENHFGWVMDNDASVNDIISKLQNIYKDIDGYNEIICNIQNYSIKTVKQMCDEYIKLYDIQHTKDQYHLEYLFDTKESEVMNNYNPMIDQIINSRKWKIVSKIKVPTLIKNVLVKITG